VAEVTLTAPHRDEVGQYRVSTRTKQRNIAAIVLWLSVFEISLATPVTVTNSML
jgi:hypothetical protein